MGEVLEKVAKIVGGKEILIGEVGWPSEGRMRDGALPSPANQALVLSGVVEAAKAGNWQVNLIEAFDQPWKRLLEGAVGGYWGLFDDGARELKFRWGEPVSNRTRDGASRLRSASALPFSSSPPPGSRGARTRRARTAGDADLAIAAIALGAGLVFGWAVLGLPMEPPEPGDRLRSTGMIVLSLLVPMAAAGAVARSAPLGGLAVALNAPVRQGLSDWSLLLAILFAATLVAAIHVALGLVFDPRYKDFQLALLSGPVVSTCRRRLGEGASHTASRHRRMGCRQRACRLRPIRCVQRRDRQLASALVRRTSVGAGAYRVPGHARAKLSISSATANAERRVL